MENNLNPNLYVVIYNFIKPSIGKCSDVSNGTKFIHALSFSSLKKFVMKFYIRFFFLFLNEIDFTNGYQTGQKEKKDHQTSP